MLRSATPATAVSYPQIELMPVPYPPDLIGVVVGAMVAAATAELVAARPGALNAYRFGICDHGASNGTAFSGHPLLCPRLAHVPRPADARKRVLERTSQGSRAVAVCAASRSACDTRCRGSAAGPLRKGCAEAQPASGRQLRRWMPGGWRGAGRRVLEGGQVGGGDAQVSAYDTGRWSGSPMSRCAGAAGVSP